MLNTGTASSSTPVLSGLPTARAVDHYAFTVPHLDEAIAYVTGVLGGELCYREGPVEDPVGDWMTRKLGVHPRATAQVALVRLGPYSNLELFQYTAPGQSVATPGPSDVGGHHLALAVADPDLAEEHLRRAGTVRLGPPDALDGARRWFLTPWGMLLSLRGPGPRSHGGFVPGPARYANAVQRSLGLLGVEHVGYTVADLDAATAFFTDVLGAEPVEHTEGATDGAEGHWPPGAERSRRTLLRTGPTANCELTQSGTGALRSRPPGNSDVGGHHLAFYVDDVDAAASYLREQRGVRLMGDPETITEGPIAGDRWLYFSTPIGIQMEIINMPDGTLPYETLTTARRATPGGLRWHDRP
ncbi:VOC family protein [Streptomyces arenae]|uniref:VOC family protein n=1 Tax=Streptomyces arenae TaxID=29301 RepID=UPI0026595535|nr:VOC family protein [Streptomyces arenae]MCG7210254.1 VOC family protein [Streptomyces arenae]